MSAVVTHLILNVFRVLEEEDRFWCSDAVQKLMGVCTGRGQIDLQEL